MTAAEFGVELDVVYENINKNGAPGLDAYEKSVMLTHAQETLIHSILKEEPAADRFPEITKIEVVASPAGAGFSGIPSFIFDLPTDIVKVLNESVEASGIVYTVLPISNEQFQVKQSKPYKYPPRRRAWRLGVSTATGIPAGLPSVEIVPREGLTLTNYKLRYVRKPTPIIVAILSDPIDGLTAVTECELSSGLHREILKLAATLAEQYYMDKYGTNRDQ